MTNEKDALVKDTIETIIPGNPSESEIAGGGCRA